MSLYFCDDCGSWYLPSDESDDMDTCFECDERRRQLRRERVQREADAKRKEAR